MKRLFYDVETTGLKPNKHSIHQLAGKVIIDGECKETFDIRMQPNPKALIDDEALKIAGVTREQILGYQPFEKGYEQFITIVNRYVDVYNKKDKFHLVGYNNRAFDDDFLRGLFKQNQNQYFGAYFWSDSIDVLPIASISLEPIRASLPDFKLKTVAGAVGIQIDESKLHDALYDIDITEQILNILTTKNQ